MFKYFSSLRSGKTPWYDVLLCAGCWLGISYFTRAYFPASWGEAGTLAILFLILTISGQLVFFLMVWKIWKLWQKRASSARGQIVSFKYLAAVIFKGYIRAVAVELILIGVLQAFHVSSLTVFNILTLSFTSFYILTTILASRYWKAWDGSQAVLTILCLGYSAQLLLLLFVKVL